jgi:hypothetical protein
LGCTCWKNEDDMDGLRRLEKPDRAAKPGD